MVRRSTWLALVILAALIGFAIYLKQAPQKAPEAAEGSPTPEAKNVFSSEEGLPNSIKVASAEGQTVEVALGPDHSWVVKQPFAGAADQGSAEAAATEISALRNLGQVDVALDTVGLTQPADTITVGFTGGTRHVLSIGDQTPSMTAYYAQLDGGPVMIVSSAGIDSLLGMLSAPPYLETPTPSPTASPSPAPVTETAAPPQGTGTPAAETATPTP